MKMNMTRRSFLAGSTAFGGLALVSSAEMCTGGAPAPSTCCGKNKSRSLYNGIEVGCITYSYRSMRQKNAEDIVKYAVEDGLGTLELKGEVVDEYLKREGARDMGRLPALRKMFDDAGVSIHIVKYGGIGGKNVKEDEYRMAVAKALGAKCITREVPKVAEYETIGRRCAALADKHGVFIAFHNHMQITSTSATTWRPPRRTPSASSIPSPSSRSTTRRSSPSTSRTAPRRRTARRTLSSARATHLSPNCSPSYRGRDGPSTATLNLSTRSRMAPTP